LIIALVLVAGYMFYGDTLLEKARQEITASLEKTTGKTVEIGELGYSPFQTITVKDLQFKDPDTGKTIDIQDLSLTFDVLDIAKNKRLSVTVEIKDIKHDDIKASLFVKIDFLKAATYKEIYLPSLLKSITFIKSNISTDTLSIDNINGTVAIENLEVPGGKLSFTSMDKDCILSFEKMSGLSETQSGYTTQLRNHDLNIECDIIKEDKNLTLDHAAGTFESVEFNLSGKIDNFTSPDRNAAVKGSVWALIKDLSIIPGISGEFIAANNIGGKVELDLDMKLTGSDISRLELGARASIKNITYNDFHITSSSFFADYSKMNLTISNIKTSLYNGDLIGDLEVDLRDLQDPVFKSVDLILSGLDLSLLMQDYNANKNNISGFINIVLALKYDELSPANGPNLTLAENLSRYKGTIDLAVSPILFDKVRLDKLLLGLILKEGQVYTKECFGIFYDGDITSEFILDLEDPQLPYRCQFNLKNSNFGHLYMDMNKRAKDIHGVLNASGTCEGYAANSYSMTGIGNIDIQNANLGPMPFLSPLLGDLYTSLQSIFAPGQIINIGAATVDFAIKGRKVLTNNLTFWGKDIYIVSKGNVGFDGTLDFSFQNMFRDPDSEDHEQWQNLLRTGIIQLGKVISKARLRGTLSEPKWEFEYTVGNAIVDNIKKFFKGISQ
jgi:hypothetical protein